MSLTEACTGLCGISLGTYVCFLYAVLPHPAQASVVLAAVYSSVMQVTTEPDLVWT